MLKERIQAHLRRYGVPKTVFCRRIDLSTESLRRYMNDELVFCKETEQRITEYLDSVEGVVVIG